MAGHRYPAPPEIDYPSGVNQPYLRRPGVWYMVISRARPYLTTCQTAEAAHVRALQAGPDWLETIVLDTTQRYAAPRYRALESTTLTASWPGTCLVCGHGFGTGDGIVATRDLLGTPSGPREGWAHSGCQPPDTSAGSSRDGDT
jgi:hypothetical protein